MTHRQLLTNEERQALLGIPLDPDGMARCFTLSRADQDLVAGRRRDTNRIGFAVQLALLRHPGIALANWSSRSSRLFSGLQSSWRFQRRRSMSMRVVHKP